MVHFLKLFALLFLSLNAMAATQPSSVPAVNFGAYTDTATQYGPGVIYSANDRAGWMIFKPRLVGVADTWSPFMKNGAMYQVPALKTLTCIRVSGLYGTNGSAQMGCGTAAAAFGDADLSGTKLYEGGTNSAVTYGPHQFSASFKQWPMFFECAASTYPAAQISISNTASLWYECQEHL